MKKIVYSRKMFMVTASLYAVGALAGGFAYAGELPGGGKVVDGSASIHQQGSTLNIDQSTDKAIISWENFSVGKDNTVNFNQPSSDSATLNRVTGDFTSQIAGQINANGSVFLVNPNGILITKDGIIDTGNFVASTLDIDNNDFLNGDYTFTKSGSNGVVSNRGTVSVDDGGFVALLGGAVKNDGTVRAHVGTVGFAGGEKIVMSFGNNDFLRVEVPTDKWKDLIDADGNKVSATLDLGGKIESRGGFIDIAVADASDILRQSISISGIVSANTVSSQDGVISISGGSLGLAGNGRITADADYGNAGRIDVAVQSLNMSAPMSATAETGNGGTIKVSLQQGASLSRGAVLDASGKQGGSVSLIGGLSGDKYYKLVGSGDFVADGSDGTGGYIDISNKNGLVGLFSGSISAKGTTTGGRIRIGGAFQGGGYNPKTSQLDTKTQDLFVNRWSDSSGLVSAGKTSLGTGVRIDTSSASGTGGTVILWADHTTNNYAQITATGGTSGGAVEISGKKKVDSFGLKRVEVGNGVILLDPKNVVISKFSGGFAQAKRIMSTTPLAGFEMDLDDNDNFGTSVALSEDGSKLAVGARGDDTGAPDNGAVYLFTVGGKGSQWGRSLSQEYKIAYGSGLDVKGGNSQFGKSVAFNADGTKLVVGMPFVKKASPYRDGRGRIFFYSVDWGKGVTNTSYLEYGNNGYFGTGVALSDDGTKLAVGESHDNNGNRGDANYLYSAGSVSLFELSGNGEDWATSPNRRRTARIVSGTGGLTLSAYDAFGYSVALSGDGSRLAVGAEGTNDSRGAVYLFTVGGSSWGQSFTRTATIADGTVMHDGSILSLDKEDFFGGSVALSDDGTKLAVGSIYAGSKDLGAVYLFTVHGGSASNLVTNVGKITDGNGVSLSSIDKFGYSVALNPDGSRLVIGAIDDNTGGSKRGAVYLLKLSGSTWGDTVEIQRVISDQDTLDLKVAGNFGSSVALSDDGTKLAVGAKGYGATAHENKGAVYLFEISTLASSWGKDVLYTRRISDGNGVSLSSGDGFGSSVALSSDGTKLAVGATGDDTEASDAGAVHLFSVIGSRWGNTVTKTAKVSSGLSLSLDDKFGSAVALSGDGSKLAVGASGDDNDTGAVHLFTVAGSGSTWGSTVRKTKTIGKTTAGLSLSSRDTFGSAVALSDNGLRLAVGAMSDDTGDNDAGAVYLFSVSGATWGDSITKTTKIAAGSGVSLTAGDGFGSSVALSNDGNRLAVGAEGDSTGGSSNINYGAVYVFNVDGYALENTVIKLHKITHNDGVSLSKDDAFGSAVALSGDGTKLVVGVRGDDTNGTNAGAAHFFTISGFVQKWGSTNSPIPDDDNFGRSVALSGDGSKLAVGAEDRDSKGVVYLFAISSLASSWGDDVVYTYRISDGNGVSLDMDDRFGGSVSLSDNGTQLAVGAVGDDAGLRDDRGAVYLFTVGGATWGSTVNRTKTIKGGVGGLTLSVGDLFGSSVALSNDGGKLAVGAVGDNTGSTDAGAVYLFTVAGSGGTWGSTVTKTTKIREGIGGISLSRDYAFGSSVSLDDAGTKLAVGVPGYGGGGTNRGAVYLFTVGGSGGTWGSTITQAVKLSDGHASVSLDYNDEFGSSVSLSDDGNNLAVGAAGGDGSKGAVHLFTVGGATWGNTVSQRKRIAHGADGLSLSNDDQFGSSVALSANGDKLAVGAYGDDTGRSDAGAVYLFTVAGSSSTWGGTVTQTKKLSRGTSLSGTITRYALDDKDEFGSSVSLSNDGTKLAVGATGDGDGGTNRGAVYLFTISTSDSTWGSTVKQAVKLSHGAFLSSGTVSLRNSDYFGVSVSLSGDGTQLAVGASGDNISKGAVYLYTVGTSNAAGATWGSTVTQAVKLSNSHASVSLDNGDEFGSSVSLSSDGTQLAVGARQDDDGGDARGAVYLYIVGGSGATWGNTVTQAVKLSDSHASVSLDNRDLFGVSVSLSDDGTKLAVGATGDDDGGDARGAVYLYIVGGSGATWGSTVTQAVKLSDSHASISLDDYDAFGNSVSLSGDGTKLAVGAVGDGDGGYNRGAVYLYTVGGATWGSTVTQAVKLSSGHASVSLDNGDEFGESVSLSSDGTKLAVGARGDDDGGDYHNVYGRGAVYLYTVGGATWGSTVTQANKVVESVGLDITRTNKLFAKQNLSLTYNEGFGTDVALSDDGTKMAVGAEFNDTGGTNRGAVYLFELSGGDNFGEDLYYTAKIAHGNGVSLNNIDRFGAGVALNRDGSRLVVGAPYDDTNGTNYGAVYLFRVGGSSWGTDVAQLSKVASSDNGYFGESVAISGDGTKVAVGAPYDDTKAYHRGVVKLYTIDNNNAFQESAIYGHGDSVGSSQTLSLQTGEQFGEAVALSDDGSKLAVGALGRDNYKGRVYLFTIGTSGGWGQSLLLQTTIGGGASVSVSLSHYDYFGSSVALSNDGSRLAVGAWGENTQHKWNAGAVYVFNVGGSSWGGTVEQRLKINDGNGVSLTSDTRFGFAVALSGDGNSLAVGASRADGEKYKNEGAVYLYKLSKSTVSPIVEKLKTGASVTLVASNDITVDDAVITTAGTGKLTLIAGRSITINSDVKINGGLVLKANDASDSSFVLNDRDSGKAEITVASGKTISGGEGDLLIKMLTGKSSATADKKQTGKITVWKADGARVSIVHLGTADANNDSEIVIRSGGQITATGDRRKGNVVIELAAEKFTNDSDRYALKIEDSNGDKGRFLIWTKSLAGTHLNGIHYDFSKNNMTYDPAKGNFQPNPITASDGDNAKYKSGILYRARDSRQSRSSYDGSSSKTRSTLTLSNNGGSGGGGSSAGTILLGASAILLGSSIAGAGNTGTQSVANVETIFNTGIYAHLRGIDMQAIYQPSVQAVKPLWVSVFNTPQVQLNYKVKYTTTYDMAFLANNIKGQKAIPVYEMDEKVYETIKRIFVQQSAPTHKTAAVDTEDTEDTVPA